MKLVKYRTPQTQEFHYQILVSAELEPRDQNLLESSTTVSIRYLQNTSLTATNSNKY